MRKHEASEAALFMYHIGMQRVNAVLVGGARTTRGTHSGEDFLNGAPTCNGSSCLFGAVGAMA